MREQYFVYILMNDSGTVLYVGVTSDLGKRLAAHAAGTASVFTRKYKVKRLVYFESFGEITHAIAREKEIKAWRREKKEKLIRQANPQLLNVAGQL